MKTIHVLLADDHALVRAGIRSLIENVKGFDVVGEAGDGHEAVRLAEALRPEVALLDVSMPRLNGFDVAERLSLLNPRVPAVILSMHTSEGHVLRALRAGCAGYLAKTSTPSELELAIRTVAGGGIYLSPVVSRTPTGVDRSPARSADPLATLTLRQREILQLVAEGNTSRAIARQLGLSAKTVDTHRAQIMERLRIHEVAGLVRFAIRVGLVEPDP